MHIAILCEYGTVNGGENSMLAMIEHLPGFQFTVIAPSRGRLQKRLNHFGLQHVPFSVSHSAGGRAATLRRLVEITGSMAPDLLHGNSLSTGRLTGAVSSRLAIPTTAHLRDILRLSRSAIADLNRNQRLFAVSQATRDFHVEQGLDPLRTEVLYNGIDGNAFHPARRTGWLHTELRVPQTAQLAATIGQISLRKGQDVLIQAAVQSAAVLPDLHWLIIGERYSTKQETIEFEATLHRKVATANLEGRVHWLGYREDIPALLPELDLLIHPARQEPLGRVLLEAGACAVPIIATTVGGTAEILDRDSALLIPPDDPAALSKAMQSLLSNPQRQNEMAAAARETVAGRFRIDDRAQELADHWRSLILAE